MGLPLAECSSLTLMLQAKTNLQKRRWTATPRLTPAMMMTVEEHGKGRTKGSVNEKVWNERRRRRRRRRRRGKRRGSRRRRGKRKRKRGAESTIRRPPHAPPPPPPHHHHHHLHLHPVTAIVITMTRV